MKKISTLFITLAFVAFGSGCATFAGPGDKQASIPPKLINDQGTIRWDNPGAFGPVPTNMAKAGEDACSLLNTKFTQFKATGYHAKAQGLDGQALKNGGYYCVAK